MFNTKFQCVYVLLQFSPCSAPRRQVMSQTAKGENMSVNPIQPLASLLSDCHSTYILEKHHNFITTSRFLKKKQNWISSGTLNLEKKREKKEKKYIKNIFAVYLNEIPSDSEWKKENFTEIRSQMSLFIILNLTYLWGRNRMKFSVEFILNYLIWNG